MLNKNAGSVDAITPRDLNGIPGNTGERYGNGQGASGSDQPPELAQVSAEKCLRWLLAWDAGGGLQDKSEGKRVHGHRASG
jgi:hypothetical protein